MASFEFPPAVKQPLLKSCRAKRCMRRNVPYIAMVCALLSLTIYESILHNQWYPDDGADSKLIALRQSLSQEVIKNSAGSKIKIETKPLPVPELKPKKKITWKEQPILTIKYDGRLGNQMFEFAAINAIARQKGMKVFLNSTHPLNKLFHIDERFVVRKPCGGFSNVEASCCDYNITLLRVIKNNTCQRIYGYFQSWRYFESYLESIRQQLTFRDAIVSKAQSKLRSLIKRHKRYRFKSSLGKCVLRHGTKAACTFIAMHVRRGDLMLPIRIRQGRLAAPKSYYLRAMEYYREKYSNVLFIIGSDSQDWAEENFAGPDALVLRDMLPEIDMSLLMQCNHTIMSVGTFGWWVSFMSGGDVIYYNKAFAPNSSSAAAYTRYDTDFARPGWIGLS